CPQDWLMFASSCYYFSPQNQRRSWDASRKYCLQNAADLVIINSTQEQVLFIRNSLLRRIFPWVGMTDREEEGKWTWVDGTPVKDERVQWARGQPDGAFGGEDCGELRLLRYFNGLNDLNCSTAIQWICEKML
uniref:C-type lectin domain-containing protein n=1 Tax=Tetraodon nigroviridis TaxID=99883 RepID=H3D4A0_TETNG